MVQVDNRSGMSPHDAMRNDVRRHQLPTSSDMPEAELVRHFARLSDELTEIFDRIESSSSSGRSNPFSGRRKSSDAELANRVKSLIASRANRSKHFPADLFADPAWCILLDLYLAELEQRRTTVSSLCIGAEVPPTTALRWIGTLVDRGLIIRRPDKLDRRRVWVELAKGSSLAMLAYFEADS